MPRIRTIKPDFFTDGKVIRLSPLARLLFIGMWNFANCDAGHVDDDPMSLKFRILPADNCDIDALIQETVDAGLVFRITADGERFLWVKGLRDHQRTDARWTPRCKACAAENVEVQTSPKLTETHASSCETQRASRKLTETHAGREGRGKEGREGKEGYIDQTQQAKFDRFWSAYPRKVGKDKARPKFATATRRADPEDIIAGAERLRDDPNLPDKQFIPHPSTWLERGGWDDEPLPPRIQPQAKTFGQQKLDNLNNLTSRYLEGDNPWTQPSHSALPPSSFE